MPSVAQVGQTIRSAKRYQEILRVLVRYGFEEFIAETKLDKWLGKGRSFVGLAESQPEKRHLPRAVRLRGCLEELGPTFIKLGQILSTRPDLVPEEWAEEFKKLQSDAPALPFEFIQPQLKQEFGPKLEQLFSHIDPTALAAGSMAQVHRATLSSGERVVVKVLKPDVRHKTETDMEVLRGLAEFLQRHFTELGYSPTEVVKEFARELKKEVNLLHEGRSTDRLRKYFEKEPHIHFPTVYWEASTRNVLCMEEIQGTLLSTADLHQFSESDREQIVRNGTDAVLRQCLEFGFFHADPHPGNIFVLPNNDICFIDCGMTGHIDRATSELLADLIAGVITGQLDRVIEIIVSFTTTDPAIAEQRTFRQDVWEFISRFEASSLDSLDIGVLLEEFFALLRRYRMRLPSDLVFLIKAITTIESVGEQLVPSFDLVGYMQPYVEDLISKRYGIGALRRRFESTVFQYARLAEDLPRELHGLFAQLRGNHFSIGLEHKKLDRLTDTIEHSSRNIAYALIICGLVVGAAILVLAGGMASEPPLSKLGIGGLIAAGVLAAILFLANYRFTRKK